MAYPEEKKPKISETAQRNLEVIIEHFNKEDKEVRERQIRQWKKLKLYWAGHQRVWWNEVAHDWRVWDEFQNLDDNDASFYDKPINLFRALLESIISALSVTIPKVSCAPKDADNPADITAAKAGNKLSQLISKDNDDALLWMYALFIYCTEGLTAAYHYSKEDEKYGTYQEPIERTVKEEHYLCPACGEIIPDEEVESPIIEEGLADKACPACGESYLPASLEKGEIPVTRTVGEETKNKSHQCIEIRGGLYVKVPIYAKVQDDCPYLRYSYEAHFTTIIERFPDLASKFKKNGKIVDSSNYGDAAYERWGRLPTVYSSDYPSFTPTVNQNWLRPSAYNVLCEDKEGIDELKRLFPTGVRVTHINEFFAEATEEKLDDRWTLAFNPLADYIHYDPIGLLLVSFQDIINDLNALTLQTIEQGIPQTFVDPAILDLDAYKNEEAAPGSVYPTKPVAANKSIAEGFHTLKTATLGTEVLPYGQKVMEMGQLASGALPSLFGGTGPQGSRTASEYAMSRAQALQRLQGIWKILNYWWKNIYGKVIPAFILDMVDDERFVEKRADGSFMNVIIRKAELEGSIGEVMLESSENLPVSWAQKKETFMEIVQSGHPLFAEAMLAPENLPFFREITGLNDMYLPGEDERTAELEDIKMCLLSPSFNENTSSVPVDPILDDHRIRAEIDRNWLISEAGRDAKVNNSEGYINVLLHMKMHMFIQAQNMKMQQQQAMAQAESTAEEQPGSKNDGKKKKTNNSAPIGEQHESRTPIQ